jgi:hypothetical protein
LTSSHKSAPEVPPFIGIKANNSSVTLNSMLIPQMETASYAVSLMSVLLYIATENHWKLAAFILKLSSMVSDSSLIFSSKGEFW